MIDVSHDNNAEEVESNRSSTLFERSKTDRLKKSDNKANNSKDYIRISTLKDLMRLFRINLKDNDTFEYSGQKYLIDLEDQLCMSSTPTSHKHIYLQQNPKTMHPLGINQPHFSPIIIQNSDQKQQTSSINSHNNNHNDISNSQSYEEINVDYNDIQFTTQVQLCQQDQEAEVLKNNTNNGVKKVQFTHQEIQVDEHDIKKVRKASVKIVEPVQEVKVEITQQQKIQQIAQEIDTFYADIAKQLALEIEMEEEETAQEEERQRQLKEQQEKEAQKEQEEFSPQKPIGLRKQDSKYHEMYKSQELTNDFMKSKNVQSESEQYQDLAGFSQSPNDRFKIRRYQTMGQTSDKLARLQQMNSEKQALMEQLNQAKQQLESLNQHIQIFNVDSKNLSEVPLHLAFLFASPLVIRQQGSRGQNSKDNFSTVPLLEFNKEFKEIKQSIKETQRNLRVRAKQATIENLTMILTQNPLALHFSGHGIENNKENFGRQFKSRQGDGNYLLFETEDGEGELVSEKMLQEFIQSSNAHLEFVFVASCYSEFAGKIFLNAGAKHVICVRSGEQIADLAVITFSKSFYNAVFSSNMTICESFKLAQKQVQGKYGLQESNKFSILVKQDGDQNSNISKAKSKLPSGLFGSQDSFNQDGLLTNHKCKHFGTLKQGEMEFLDQNPRFKEYPAKVDKFIGRQKEMFEIVHNVFNHRLVTLIGLPGIGKTSLCKNAVHYIADRKIFKQGIVFLPLKGYMSFELFMKKLVVNFVMTNFELDKEEQKDIQNSNIEELLKITLQYLKQTEENLLIVFDNVEDLLQADKHAFRILVNDLLVQIPNLHILMTSRTTLGALQDISEKILILQELSPFYTVELFISRSREIPELEISELLEYQPENQILLGDSATKKDQKVKNLADHHFFKILGGNPHAIILAAPILIRMNLKQLYQLLNSKEMHDVLQVDGIKDSTVASLRLSLEASIKVLQKEDQTSLELFFLVGMLPGGIEENELQNIWGDDYQKHVEMLINFSLIQRKELPNEQKKLTLPPFMSQYAEAKISQDLKLIFQNDICHYYANICHQILMINGRSYKKQNRQSELNHQIMEKLLKHETNIWACIYRMVDNHQVHSEKDSQSLREYLNTKLRRISTMMAQISPQKQDLINLQDESVEVIQKPERKRNKVKVKRLSLFRNNSSDIADQRPFEIMTSQTPRSENEKNFSFPENEQKTSQSHLITNSNLKNIEEEENESDKTSKSFDSEDDSQDDDDDEDDQEEQFYVQKSSNSKDILKSQIGRSQSKNKIEEVLQGKQSKLDHILRNSYVNFQKPSSQLQGSAQLMQMIKQQDVDNKSLQRRMTMTSKNFAEGQNHFLSLYKQNNSLIKNKQQIEELHAAEKLIIYYVMNLFLLRENENALSMINDFALKAHGSVLYEANIYRILGLIQHNKVEIEKSLEAFKKAKQLYVSVNSTYGIALCKFSIAYIYRSKITEFITQTDEDVILKRSKQGFESALQLFQELNHIVGQALCCQQLSLILTKLQNRKESTEHSKNYMRLMKIFSNYPVKAECPHISRVHGNEISLMSEIINDNDKKNMFPAASSTETKIMKVKKKSLDVNIPVKQNIKIKKLQHHNSETVVAADIKHLSFKPSPHQNFSSVNVQEEDVQVEDFEYFNGKQKLSEQQLPSQIQSQPSPLLRHPNFAQDYPLQSQKQNFPPYQIHQQSPDPFENFGDSMESNFHNSLLNSGNGHNLDVVIEEEESKGFTSTTHSSATIKKVEPRKLSEQIFKAFNNVENNVSLRKKSFDPDLQISTNQQSNTSTTNTVAAFSTHQLQQLEVKEQLSADNYYLTNSTQRTKGISPTKKIQAKVIKQ